MSLELSVLFVLLGAFFAPLFAKALRMPVAVGELVYGLALGFLLGGYIAEVQTVKFLSEFGFLLLMLLVGLEINFDLLGGIPKRHMGIYLLYFIGVFAVGVPFVAYLNLPMSLVAVLCLISVGVLLVSLKESGLLDSEFGTKLLVLGVVGEIVSLVVITFLHKFGEFQGIRDLVFDLSITVGFFLLLALAFKVIKLFLWWFPEVVRFLSYEKDASALGIRLSLFMMFFLSVLAHISGVESAVGAFLAGAVISYFLRDKEDLEHKLSAMGYGFLIPIFFIYTGAKTDVSAFSVEVLKNSLLILGIMLLVRYVPSPLLLFAGFSAKQLIPVPLMLAYPFTLMIAGVEILNRMGVLEGDAYLSLLTSAVLSTLLFPWFGRLLLRLA